MAQVTFAPVKTTARNLGGTITYYIDGKLIPGVGEKIPLSSLDDYARGSVIVGGAAEWEAFAAKTDGAFLVGDGTDVESRVLAAADIQTISGITWTQAQTFDAAITLNADTTIADGKFVGLGAAKGRVEFHDATFDAVAVMDARLGVGVDDPDVILDIQKNDSTGWQSGVPQIRVTNTNTVQGTGAGGTGYNFASFQVWAGNGVVQGYVGASYNNVGIYDSYFSLRCITNHPVYIWTNDTKRLTVAATGEVGIGTTTPDTRLDIAAGALTFSEMTAPSAPAANGCALYVEDNGSGKTRLMALFSSGAAQQVAIQP